MEKVLRQFKQQQHEENGSAMDMEIVGGKKQTTEVIVSGSSVLGCIYNGGVMMTADTLLSYGSMLRFQSVQRLRAVNEHTIIGASGEYSDFQHIVEDIKAKNEDVKKEKEPREVFNYLSEVMYSKRNKFDPYYNKCVVAGFKDGKPFLGCVDYIGTNFTSYIVGTGFGQHMALPIMRNFYQSKKDIKDISENDARSLLEKCMLVLSYRDARTKNKVQFAKVDANGVSISDPVELKGEWDMPGN